jgi:hypothetical protein
MNPPKKVPIQGFALKRDVPEGVYPLTEIVKGLECSPALMEIFPDPDQREKVLAFTKVRIRSGQGYMRVDDAEKTIIVAQDHIRFSDECTLYLDFVHELTHIKQAMGGKNIYSSTVRYAYKDTEIEAYEVAVREGRRIGMTEGELKDYLEVPWITEEEFKFLLRRLGVYPH